MRPVTVGRSSYLVEARNRVWAVMASDPDHRDGYGLFPDLPFDATWARAQRGELEQATPRLLQLLTDHAVPVVEAAATVGRFGAHTWSSRSRREAVEALLDAWWAETLQRDPGEHVLPYDPPAVLGVIAAYGAPMIRWLQPWLHALDGPGSPHLAAAVLGGLDGPAWTGRHDEAAQVLAWARTETVVNGLTLIGGTHLDDGVLGDLLDVLLG